MKQMRWIDNSNGRMDMALPDETTYAPRDGERIGRSLDWLFELWLTRNLVLNQHQYRAILHYRNTHWLERGYGIYLLEHRSGRLHHPITLGQVQPDSVEILRRMKIGTMLMKICRPLIGYEVRSQVYDHFFLPADEVKGFSIPGDSPEMLKIADLTIYPSPQTPSAVLKYLNSSLLWPLVMGADSILDRGKQCLKTSTFNQPSLRLADKVLPIIRRFFEFSRNCLPG